MNARKIDLTTYTWTTPEGKKEVIKPALNLRRFLTAPVRQLNGAALLDADDVAVQLRDGDKEVLLSEEDWEQLCKALDDMKGLSDPYVILVRRVLKAAQVKVEETKAEKDAE